MITSGTLMLIDAGLTLTWQEPVSAFLAGRQQSRLEDELELGPELPEGQRSLVGMERLRPGPGRALGRIELPSLDRSYVMVEGTDTATLRRGPGHYPDTPLPGQRGTVAVAGHRTTYGAPFRTVDELRRGDPIVVRMPHGRFTYRVESTRIVGPRAVEVKRAVGHDRLILSACHPLYSAAQRIVVFARIARPSVPPLRLARG